MKTNKTLPSKKVARRKSLNYDTLVTNISESTGLQKYQVKKIYQALLDEIVDNLKAKEDVSLPRLVKFEWTSEGEIRARVLSGVYKIYRNC